MPIPSFFDREILDQYVRENFRKLREFLRSESPLLGFEHFEITVGQAVTDQDFRHNLGFVPTDLIQTFVSDGATVTWDYDAFTRENVRFSTSAGCTFRFFLGRFDGVKR